MQNYIFQSSLKFEENCKALPAFCRPTDEQIKEWNRLANKQVRDEYSCASKEYYAWIGVNPPADQYTMKELWDLAKLPYENYIICVEQYTEGGIRPHLHALAKVSKNTRPNKEVRRLQKLFSLENAQSVEYKVFGANLLSARMKYMRGEKAEGKSENVEKDREKRKEYKIPNFLSIGTI